MARESIVGEKSLAYAKRIAKCYRYLKDKKKESVMSKQLLRSGTSIGANVREGIYAQSRKDFISKLNIALKKGDGGQVPVPSFIFSKLHKNAPISTEKGASCINKQRFAIAA